MSLQTELTDKIKQLPEHQQMLLKSLVDELIRTSGEEPRNDTSRWFGCLEPLGLTITEQDIDEARREMWSGFPRDIEL